MARAELDVSNWRRDDEAAWPRVEDALSIWDKLNRRLGYDRKAWTAMDAASMHAEDDDPVGSTWH